MHGGNLCFFSDTPKQTVEHVLHSIDLCNTANTCILNYDTIIYYIIVDQALLNSKLPLGHSILITECSNQECRDLL